MDVPMELARIMITEHGDPQMIFLREIDGERTVPIVIGIAEAMAIDRRLKGITPPRPMTHDLLAGVIETLGGRIDRIVISDLREHTFFATLVVEQQGQMLEIDARPSDAIALGVAMKTPIFVAEQVLETLSQSAAVASQRVQMLRDHLAELEHRIVEMERKQSDPAFLEGASQEVIEHVAAQLNQARTERDAIRAFLDKLA